MQPSITSHPLGAQTLLPALSPTPYLLPPLPYLRLRITLRALEPAQLPPFLGSLLRGAFGHSFRRTVCTVGPGQECASCRLRRECAYARVFETRIEPGMAPPSLRGQVAAPHPYVFESLPSRGDYVAGDEIGFDLLLFGDAIDDQARVLLAIERMGEAGLGACRARFALERVEAIGGLERIPLFSDGVWASGVPARGLPMPAGSLPGDGRRVRLRFLTPLRVRREGNLVAPRDPRELVYLMLRRVLEVAHFHTREPRIDWHFRPLLDAASALTAPEWRFRFVRLARYSNRQGATIDLDGYLGTAVLEGDLEPFVPLLRAAEVLHVGKGAVFGLGRIKLEAA